MHQINMRTRVAALPLTAALAGTLLAALFLLLSPRVARAGGVVSPCNQANLEAALAGGGSVSFNCGGPATITVTSQIVITQDTTLDGGALGLVTISGGSSTRIFSTALGVNLQVFNLALIQGDALSGFGGAVYALGPTVVSNSTFYNNAAVEGGAVFAGNTAPITVTNSLFFQNSADDGGGALSARADTRIAASRFDTNFAGEGGGVYVVDADLQVANSLFQHNEGGSEGGGLAFYNGAVIIAGSEFYSNSADYGGAIASYGRLTLTNSSLHHNLGLEVGGAMYLGDMTVAQALHAEGAIGPQGGAPGQVMMAGVDIYNNVVQNTDGYGGGIDLEVTGFARFDHVRIYNNRILDGDVQWAGGGVAVFYGDVVFSNSAIFGNSTFGGPGGGIHASYGATLTLQNTAVYSNVAEAGAGGGIDIDSVGGQTRLRIYNSTISGNSADMGGGINMNAASTYAIISFTTLYGNVAAAGNNFTGTTELFSSILAGSGGLNCGGAVKSFGYNLEDGDTCTFGGTGDITGTNPLLGPLGPNGGPTWSHYPLAGSPVVDAANPVGCPPTDQRGAARPVDGDNAGGAVCDMGAVEFAAIVAKIFLPLVLR